MAGVPGVFRTESVLSSGRHVVLRGEVSRYSELVILKLRPRFSSEDCTGELEREADVLRSLRAKNPDAGVWELGVPLVICAGAVLGPAGGAFDHGLLLRGTGVTLGGWMNVSELLRVHWRQRVEQILSQVHRAGFVHGDLKPDHMDHVLLIDFGGAVRVGEQHAVITSKYAAANAVAGGPATAADDLERVVATFARRHDEDESPETRGPKRRCTDQ